MGSRFYELTLVFHPHQGENIPSLLHPYLELIQQHEGKLIAVEDWGKRTLAYPIKKLQRANYILLFFSSTPQCIKEIKEALGYDKNVLRSLVINKLTGEYRMSELACDDESSKQIMSKLNINAPNQGESHEQATPEA